MLVEENSIQPVNSQDFIAQLAAKKLLTYVDIATSILGEDHLRRNIADAFLKFDHSAQRQPLVDFSFGSSHKDLVDSTSNAARTANFDVADLKRVGFHIDGVSERKALSVIETQVAKLFPTEALSTNVDWLKVSNDTRAAFFRLGFFKNSLPLQMMVIDQRDEDLRCVILDSPVQKRAIESLIKLGYTDRKIASGGKDVVNFIYWKQITAQAINRKLGIDDFAMELRNTVSPFPGIVQTGEINNRSLFLARWINAFNSDREARGEAKIDFESYDIGAGAKALLLDTRNIHPLACEINGHSPIFMAISRGKSSIVAEISKAQANLIRGWPKGNVVFDVSDMSKLDEAATIRNFKGLIKRINTFGRVIHEKTGVVISKHGRVPNTKLIFPVPLE